MTHFDRDIRLDALLVLNVWLERFPSLLRHKTRDLLGNFVSLLGHPAIPGAPNAAGGGAARPTLQIASFSWRQTALQSLHKFVTRILGNEDELEETETRNNNAEVHPYVMDATGNLENNAEVTEAERGTSSLEASVMQLAPLLVGAWLECSPSEPDSQNAEKLTAMNVILETLYGLLAALGSPLSARVSDLVLHDALRFFMPYFPFAQLKASGAHDKKTMHMITGINVRIVQIMSLLLPHDLGAKCPEWAMRITAYCSDAFHAQRGEMPVPAESPLTPALLRVVPLLLLRQPGLDCGALLKSFSALFEHCKPQSSGMRAALALVAFLLTEESKIDRSQVLPWLQSLPRLLWSLQATSPSTTKLVLSLMATYGRRASANSAPFDTLLQGLVPFLFVSLKKRDHKSYGPFVKLPEDIQRDAVELFFYFSHLTTPALQALSAICKGAKLTVDSPGVSVSVASFALQLVHTRFCASFAAASPFYIEPSLYLSFLSTTLIVLHTNTSLAPEKQPSTAEERRTRAAALSDPLFSAVRSLPLPRLATLQTLLPILTQVLSAVSVPMPLRRALLRLVHAVVAPVEVFTQSLQLSALPEPLPALLPQWLVDLSTQDEQMVGVLVHLLTSVAGLLPSLLAELLRRMHSAPSELITQFCRVVLTLCRTEEMRALLQAERVAVRTFRASISGTSVEQATLQLLDSELSLKHLN